MWGVNPSQYSLSLMAFYLISGYELHLIYVIKLPKRIHKSLKSVTIMDLSLCCFSFFLQLWECNLLHSWVSVCTRWTTCNFAMRIGSHHVNSQCSLRKIVQNVLREKILNQKDPFIWMSTQITILSEWTVASVSYWTKENLPSAIQCGKKQI